MIEALFGALGIGGPGALLGLLAGLIATVLGFYLKGRLDQKGKDNEADLAEYKETRQRIDDAVRNTPDDIRQWLRDRSKR